jgi:hypothetical protein
MVPTACTEVVAPGQSRRDFILIAASAVGALGALGTSRHVFAHEARDSNGLPLGYSRLQIRPGCGAGRWAGRDRRL